MTINGRIERAQKMLQSTLSLTARRELLTEQVRDLYMEGGQLPYIKDTGSSLSGIIGRIATAGPADLNDIQTALNEAEDRALHLKRLDRADQQRDEDAARAREPLTEDDPEFRAARELTEESNRRAARVETVEGKLDTLIALNERVLNALEKK